MSDEFDLAVAQAERLHGAGNFAEAEARYRSLLDERPKDAHLLQLLAALEDATGRRAQAIATLLRAIEAKPGSAAIENDLGSLLFASGDFAGAEARFSRALATDPSLIIARVNLGNVLRRLGRVSEAIAALHVALAWDPDSGPARNALGSALREAGDQEGAEAQYRWALRLDPNNVEAACNLGAQRLALGHAAEALAIFQSVLARWPTMPMALVGAGSAYRTLGRLPESESHLARALEHQPNDPEAHLEIGRIYAARALVARAELSFRRALAIRPAHAESHAELGNALQAQGRYDEAVACYRRALEIRPEFPEALNDLGCCLNNQGFHEEAAATLRRAMALRPGFAQAHTNLIFTLDMMPGRSAAEDFAEKKRWGDDHAARFRSTWQAHANDRDPERRLKIGYVSGDFRHHSAASVIGAVLFNHDPEAVEVFAYANVAMPDDLTAAFKARVDHWHDVTGMDDVALERLIREDRIDILVDLSGHSAGNRLLVFARKPAPIQVTAWGYGLGTGIAAIDYILIDPETLPPVMPPPFAETPYILPISFGYRPPKDAPDPAPPPFAATGRFTFGIFSRATKINDHFLGAVASLLRRVPTARLVIKDIGIDDAGVRRRIELALGAGGIASARVDLLGKTQVSEHLAAHALVDLMLNPFPHGGGVSVLEALWMGVPVLCFPGERAQGRNGMMMVKAAGLADLIVASDDDFVERAVGAAGEGARWADLRPNLRARMRQNALGDQVTFCRSVEAAYRDMWRRWTGDFRSD